MKLETSSFSIGIDLGGTRVKAAAFDAASGECRERVAVPTRDAETQDGIPAFQEQVASALASLEESLGCRASAVGVSAPGLADPAGDRIRTMPGRLQGLENLSWADCLGRAAVPVLNDAHAALLGEIWQGAARDRNDVVLITIGTGVGGAVVSGGRLLRGHTGRAGHIGHMSVDFRGAPDICNCPGSIEDAIGNGTVAARSGGRFANTSELLDALAADDPHARAVWSDSVRALAAAIGSLINILDPEIVLVGGGVAEAGRILFDPLQEALDEFEWRPGGHRVSIRKAALGEWAGACGAAWNAAERMKAEG